MKTKLLQLFVLLFGLLSSQNSSAQTTIGQQDFEIVPAAPVLGYSATGGATSTGNGLFPTDPKFVSGTQGYEVNNGNQSLTFDVVNTASYTGITLSMRLASFAGSSGNGADGSDKVEIAISTDGGTTWSDELEINGNNNAKWSFATGTGVATTAYDGNNAPTNFTPTSGGNITTEGYSFLSITNIPIVTTLRVRVTMSNNAANETWVIDDLKIEGTLTAACSHTISSFAPTSGPEGTEVTINGAGFTASSTVDFNGTAPSALTFVDANTLIATVPAGLVDGVINVTESSCTESTASSFSLLTTGGSCGVVYSDLLITEVYDADGGSLGYIEIYNGTGATIDLTDYQIDRYATLTGASSSHSYTFPGSGVGSSIANGQVLFGKVSTNAGTADFDFTGSTAGFNDDDRLELVHSPSGNVIDDWHDETVTGTTGYSYLRNTSVVAPNPFYDPTEWTASGTESTADLGNFPISSSSPPTINTHPADVAACAVTMSVNATSSGGTLTYQWLFNANDGTDANWTAVTGAAFAGTTVIGATSTSLSITGNLAPYDNYQFHCQVIEDGSCFTISDAAQFTIDGDRFFRSAASGNWTNVNNWEVATSAAGPWSPACSYPVFDNSDYVHIINGHTLDVNLGLTIDQVVIEDGATIGINSNQLLTINNGTGIDLDVIGTLIDRGIGNGNGIDLSTNGATWVLNPNGSIIKTGSSSVTQYRDNYEGGIVSIPATANWTFRHDASTGTVAVVTIGMYYPNLYMESTSGDYAFNSGVRVFTGLSGVATVKGNMYIGNTGTGAVDVHNNNTNTSGMQILGDLVLGGNGSASISKFVNDQGGTTGTGLEIFGDLIIHTNGLLDFDNGTAAADGTVRLHGDWNNLNTGNGFDEGNSTVEFAGAANQTVNKAGGSSENMYNVIINKSTNDVLNNVSDLTIENDMTFVNGIVRTTSSAYLLFEAAATTSGASHTSHVDGPVIKETNSGTITNFTYPTGDNGIYGAIGIETRFHAGEYYTAEYFNVPHPDLTVNTAELDHVSQFEHWLLDEVVGGTGEELKVTLHWSAHSKVISLPSLRVAHYYTQAPSLTDRWESEGNTAFTGNATSGSVTSEYVTTFSPFTLSDIIFQNSLPLDLLQFTATKVGKTGELYWQVANEKATDRYCLQRSADALTFETLQCFDATQDNALAHYDYIDAQPLAGQNYYRIHQIDYLGDHNYSPIRVLNFETTTGIILYPTPADENITIELPRNITVPYTIKVIDELGRVLMTEKMATGAYTHTLDVSRLATGAYILRIEGVDSYAASQKFIVSH